MKNWNRKEEKYKPLIERLKSENYDVTYVNLSMSALGIVYKNNRNDITKFLKEYGLADNEVAYYTKKIINIAIRTSYYIFCMRNKTWSDPELMEW